MPDFRTLGSLAAVMLLLVTASAPAAATSQHKDDRAFVVELNEDGSATVTIQFAYNLGSDSERAAFEDLKQNETKQKEFKTEFRNRMQRVAAQAENQTGREMSVTNAKIAFETRDSGKTGVVSLSVTWKGLAATQDGSLIVTEPFASDFEPDRRFTVRGPDGYQLASAKPSPAEKKANAAIWSADADLSGFKVTFNPAKTTQPTETPTPTETKGPGFGVVAALIALLGAGLLARRKR